MIFYILSMVVHMWLAIRLCRSRGVTWRAGVALGLCYIWGMSVGAKILYDLLNSRLDWCNYLDISYYFHIGPWGGPLAYLTMGVIGVLVLARDRRMMLDTVALALPVPMVLAKVACFVNGCCYGAESSVSWAMALAEGTRGPGGVPRHPALLYEILVLVVILVVFATLDRHSWKGTFVAWFVLLYGLGQPLTELFRATDELRTPVGPFSASQLTCLAAAVVAAVSLPLIGIGGSLAAPPLPHHRAYGSVPRRFDRVKRSKTQPLSEGRSSRNSRSARLAEPQDDATCANILSVSRPPPPRGAWERRVGVAPSSGLGRSATAARCTCVVSGESSRPGW